MKKTLLIGLLTGVSLLAACSKEETPTTTPTVVTTPVTPAAAPEPAASAPITSESTVDNSTPSTAAPTTTVHPEEAKSSDSPAGAPEKEKDSEHK